MIKLCTRMLALVLLAAGALAADLEPQIDAYVERCQSNGDSGNAALAAHVHWELYDGLESLDTDQAMHTCSIDGPEVFRQLSAAADKHRWRAEALFAARRGRDAQVAMLEAVALSFGQLSDATPGLRTLLEKWLLGAELATLDDMTLRKFAVALTSVNHPAQQQRLARVCRELKARARGEMEQWIADQFAYVVFRLPILDAKFLEGL